MQEQNVLLPDVESTKALGRQLALNWLKFEQQKPCLLLEGNLGSGKTTLVQGIAEGLEIFEPVTSPTFALAQHYRGLGGALTHLDLYRLEQPASADEVFCQEEEEAHEMGALMAVEWAERLSFKPQKHWMIYLELIDLNKPQAGRLARLKY